MPSMALPLGVKASHLTPFLRGSQGGREWGAPQAAEAPE